MQEYDLFVIGTGMSGKAIATKAAKAKLKTGIADYRPFGGTCALRGCDPKKILMDVAKAKSMTAKYAGKGLGGEVKIEWAGLMKFKNGFTDKVPGNMEESYQESGVDTFHEAVSFLDEDTLKVGDTRIKAKQIVVATGARPADLPIPGAAHTITSNDFLQLEELPESITFLGGGYIAFEFAHLAIQAGAKVTIIEKEDIPLQQFEKELVEKLVKVSKDKGIEILLNTEVKEIRKNEGAHQVIAESQEGEKVVESQLVVNAAGRVPEIDQLNLEKGNVEFSKKGIKVNKYLQSVSNPRVYAAGDVSDSRGLQLTPVAVLEGHVAASNIIKGNNKVPQYTEMPSVVFSIPPLASVGLTEEMAKAQKKEYRIKSGDGTPWFNGYRSQTEVYSYKVLISKEDDTILGAHLLAPSAEETINLFALAMEAKIPAKTLKTLMYSYPSWASDLSFMV